MTDTITLKRSVIEDTIHALERYAVKRQDFERFESELAMLKAALAAPQPAIQSDQDVIENLMTTLQWYADGNHFSKADPDAWDTVSGEPQNWWCDEAGTAMVEDGSLAKMVLSGEITGAQLQAMEDGEVFEPQPEPQPVSHDNLKGVDAGPLSEWVDLVKRGYVPKDELLIRASDAARVVAQSEPQPVKQALSMSMFASKADYDEAMRAKT